MLFKAFSKALLAYCSIVGLLCFNPAQAQTQKLPLEGYVLDVGLSPIPPFVMIKGQFTDVSGIDVDIIRELQRRTGFTLNHNRFHMMSLVDLIDSGKQGALDICASGLVINKSYSQHFTVSPTTYRSKYVVVVPTNSTITNRDDLVGKTLVAEDGTNPIALLPQNIASQVNVINQHTTFMTFYAVAAGEADAMLAEEPMATDVVDDWAKGKLKVAYTVKNSDRNIAMLFKKGTYETKILYETFEQMLSDGTIENIIHKYAPDYDFPEDLKSQSSQLANNAAL